ncbi:hypothetical protein DM860_002453 [Cuscuta australis]|uniref:Uncharacterized protein n=1 Tax=Cuscuta australis TaxID=267555 RepID=A0A328CYC0_9ASTE|nr:hypothetical protein DM860_002453 [Cuscuta australis]
MWRRSAERRCERLALVDVIRHNLRLHDLTKDIALDKAAWRSRIRVAGALASIFKIVFEVRSNNNEAEKKEHEFAEFRAFLPEDRIARVDQSRGELDCRVISSFLRLLFKLSLVLRTKVWGCRWIQYGDAADGGAVRPRTIKKMEWWRVSLGVEPEWSQVAIYKCNSYFLPKG